MESKDNYIGNQSHLPQLCCLCNSLGTNVKDLDNLDIITDQSKHRCCSNRIQSTIHGFRIDSIYSQEEPLESSSL